MSELRSDIEYERTRNGANNILKSAKVMEGIFYEFNQSMQRVKATDVYVGDAKETMGARYDSLKSKFDDYIMLVNQFANMILSAAEATEKTEAGLARTAENLKD